MKVQIELTYFIIILTGTLTDTSDTFNKNSEKQEYG